MSCCFCVWPVTWPVIWPVAWTVTCTLAPPFREIAETSWKVTNVHAQSCPETSASFHNYFSFFEIPWVAEAQSSNPSTQSLLWSDGSHRWVGSNPGKAKIKILSSSKKLKNKSKKSKWSRTNSALTSSNSRIKPQTYWLCVLNLEKSQLWYIPERRKSFTSRSAEVTS